MSNEKIVLLVEDSDDDVPTPEGGDLAREQQARLSAGGRFVGCFVDHFESRGHVI